MMIKIIKIIITYNYLNISKINIFIFLYEAILTFFNTDNILCDIIKT